ncbi:MAG: cation diffusion facilitator family transporter [Bacteroides sp.]
MTMSNDKEREKRIYRVTLTGSVVNLLLLLFKFAAGILGHSAAMVADAVHSLSDFATDLIVIAFVRISSKPEDAHHAYGHGKYETLATAIIGTVLFGVAVGIFWNGVTAIYDVICGEQLTQPSMLALGAALLSVALKEWTYRYTIRVGKQVRSAAVIANAWHHRSDALSSVGTTVGIGGAVLLGSYWTLLDPLAAVVVSLFIARVSVKLLVPCVDELLEKSLSPEVEETIRNIILKQPGVSQPHHLRTRRIGNAVAIEVHIRMEGSLPLTEAHAASTSIEQQLKKEFGPNTFISIHVEPLKN